MASRTRIPLAAPYGILVASASGEAPLTFQWYKNGSPTLETDSIYTADVGDTDFTLVARVSDTWGQIRDDTVEVDVTTSQFDVCPG